MIAGGGQGAGISSLANATQVQGGAGGLVVGFVGDMGSEGITGQAGGFGLGVFSTVDNQGFFFGGSGGAAPRFGTETAGGKNVSSGAAGQQNGNAATEFGSGGSGGASFSSASNGGDGKSGVVYVTEFLS